MAKTNRLWGYATHGQSGLGLIEVSMLILLVSLLLIPILQVMSLERKSSEISQHNGTTLDLANALVNYALENGAYPLPAAPKLAINNPKVFMPATGAEIPTDCTMTGAEGQTSGADNGIICRPKFNWASWNDYAYASSVNAQVYVGTLPVSVLGLPPEKGVDEYGHKFTYIVTRILTNNATFNDNGGSITIADSVNSTKYSNAHFAIVSHGKDGSGSWSQNGTLLGPGLASGSPCPWGSGTGRYEFGNQYQCKRNANGGGHIGYVRAIFKNGTTIQERSTYEATGDTFYDDSVAFKTSVYGRLWTPRDDGANQNEYFSASKNVGVGAINGGTGPAQKFTIFNGNALTTPLPAATKAAVKSPRFCDAASSKCFMPEDVATDVGPTAPLYCGASVGLKGVGYLSSSASASKNCYSQPIRATPLANCSQGIKGMTAAGVPICAP